MAESVYKIVELVETSTESWEKAASAAVKRASGSLRDLRIAEVEKLDLVIEKGKVTAARSSTEQDSYSLFPHLNDTFTLARKARSKLRGKRSAAWLCLCGWLILYPAAAAAPGASTFELEHGAITYTVVHKLHEVKGTTHALEGRAQLLPSGELRVQVRTRLKTFDSGNSNRDEHMREATHEPEHPFSEIKGRGQGVRLPLATPLEVQLDATVQLNGIGRQQRIAVQLTTEGSAVRARFSFPISLDAFRVERPELLLMKVEDRVQIEGDLLFGGAAR